MHFDQYSAKVQPLKFKVLYRNIRWGSYGKHTSRSCEELGDLVKWWTTLIFLDRFLYILVVGKHIHKPEDILIVGIQFSIREFELPTKLTEKLTKKLLRTAQKLEKPIRFEGIWWSSLVMVETCTISPCHHSKWCRRGKSQIFSAFSTFGKYE